MAPERRMIDPRWCIHEETEYKDRVGCICTACGTCIAAEPVADVVLTAYNGFVLRATPNGVVVEGETPTHKKVTVFLPRLTALLLVKRITEGPHDA